jgi:ABC-type Mn2+/Zn2+ transport system permease subunit
MSILIPFEYEFFRNGFIAAVVIGALCGLSASTSSYGE